MPGASDCKNSLTGVLAALEHLLEGGWQPTRTVVLAFGHDEEIGGPQGAASVASFLLETYGKVRRRRPLDARPKQAD